MAENRCVCCGEIVPEGRMVCPTCEARAGAPKYDHHEFFHHKRPTNADRIRAMSDEELAEWLFEVCCFDSPFGCPAFDKKLSMEKSCREYWLDWLRQEASE